MLRDTSDRPAELPPIEHEPSPEPEPFEPELPQVEPEPQSFEPEHTLDLVPVPRASTVASRSAVRSVAWHASARLAIFLGGFLTCLGLALLLSSVHGAPGATTTPSPAATPVQTAAAITTPSPTATPARTAPSAAGGEPGLLVTLPPIVKPPIVTPTDLADGFAVGAATAPVTVDVWEDFQCPYCRQFTLQVEPQIVTAYVETGRVRLVFHDLAFLGDESRWAAVAAAGAEDQGRFWPYHDYLFANQLGENVGSFTVDRLETMASAVGLNRTVFDAGLALDAARARFAQIEQESVTGATRLGIQSTPTVVVNGTVLAGSDWATVSAAIDGALPGSSNAPSSSSSPGP